MKAYRFTFIISFVSVFLFFSSSSSASEKKLKVIKIVSADQSNCALFSNGKAKCWGSNFTWGQLGTEYTGYDSVGDRADSMAAQSYVQVGEEIGKKDEFIIDIGMGAEHTCVLFKTGKVKCWGGNANGQLGLGTDQRTVRQMKDLPYVLIGEEIGREDEKAIKLFLSRWSTCVIFKTHKAKCWGRNVYGQLGIGSDVNVIGKTAEEMKTLPYVQIGEVIGRENEIVEDMYLVDQLACAIFTNGKAKCWGDNFRGNSGIDSRSTFGRSIEDMKSLPYVKVGSEVGRDDEELLKLAPSAVGNCAIFKNGRARCWGYDFFASLGIGMYLNQTPIEEGAMAKAPYVLVGETIGRKDEKIIDMQAGLVGNFACAIFSSGKMKCWGLNGYGQLGIGDGQEFEDIGSVGRNPEDFKKLPYVYIGNEANTADDVPIQLAVGDRHVCVLYSNGKIQCWGANYSGQLGVDDEMNRGRFLVDEEGVMSPYVKIYPGGRTSPEE